MPEQILTLKKSRSRWRFLFATLSLIILVMLAAGASFSQRLTIRRNVVVQNDKGKTTIQLDGESGVVKARTMTLEFKGGKSNVAGEIERLKEKIAALEKAIKSETKARVLLRKETYTDISNLFRVVTVPQERFGGVTRPDNYQGLVEAQAQKEKYLWGRLDGHHDSKRQRFGVLLVMPESLWKKAKAIAGK